MGRLSSVLFVLLAACGDNATLDGAGPGPDDEISPDGNASVVPRYVPAVCNEQTWSTSIVNDPALNVSVIARPDGAAVLATPRVGGSLTGFVLDTRMNMVSASKVPIDGSFSQVVASVVNDRVVSSAVQDGAVLTYLLDNDLGNPQAAMKVPGGFIAEPAFYRTQADLVMPVAGNDGLWVHRFGPSFESRGSEHVATTAPARSMAAAQIGVAMLAAWSTDNDCYMMMMSTFFPGLMKRVPVACAEPRISANQNTGDAVMVFDSSAGVRMMKIYQTQFGGDASLLREGTSAPRTLFDGTNFWISYLDARGDVIVGFLDGEHQLVTMSLAGPKPERGAYELVMIDGSPWIFALNSDGYTAHRLCVDAQWE